MTQTTYDSYDADVNRRIEASESRIKYWVISGIVANLLAMMGVGIPMVYYLGTLNAQTTQAIADMNKSVLDREQQAAKISEIEYRQRSAIQFLHDKFGYQTPEKFQ